METEIFIVVDETRRDFSFLSCLSFFVSLILSVLPLSVDRNSPRQKDSKFSEDV